MRIVHVADSFAPDIGGIERQVETLVRHQMSQGHDVTVITAVAETADLDSELDVVRAATGRWLTVAFPWRNRKIVMRVLDGRPIDVLHAHFTVISPMAVYVTRLAGRRGIPVAATVHSLWWRVAAATRVCTVPFGWGRMKAAWSGVSSVAATHVRRTLLSVHDVSVVPNLIDVTWWRTGMPPHRRAGETTRIVIVGRLKKRKHIADIIDVVAQVRHQAPPTTRVSVSIVGSGPRRADLQRQIEDLELTDWVQLLGHLDTAAVRELHHHSDLFIASSRQEAFGIAAFEARAAGLPVIGYQGNGLVDYIVAGVDGVLVTDQNQMAEAILALIRNPEKLQGLLDNAATPPTITEIQATRAIADLYTRARQQHQHRTPERRRLAHIGVCAWILLHGLMKPRSAEGKQPTSRS